jgi:hypothetical protein
MQDLVLCAQQNMPRTSSTVSMKNRKCLPGTEADIVVERQAKRRYYLSLSPTGCK